MLFGMMTIVPIRAYSWGIRADRALDWMWVELWCCVWTWMRFLREE